VSSHVQSTEEKLEVRIVLKATQSVAQPGFGLRSLIPDTYQATLPPDASSSFVNQRVLIAVSQKQKWKQGF
jgi:hypothetical protein